MKKLLYILLMIPALAWGQSQPVTLQFRRPDPQVNSLDSIYYTFPGKLGGYSWFWNAAKIRDYVSTHSGGAYTFGSGLTNDGSGNISLGGTLTQDAFITGTFNILLGDVTGASYILMTPDSHTIAEHVNDPVNGGSAHLGLSPVGVSLYSQTADGRALSFNTDTLNGIVINDNVLHKGMKYGFRNYANLGDSSLTPKAYVDSVAIAHSGANPDSTLHPRKNLSELDNKATARLNLQAQRATFVSALDFVTDTTGATNVSTGLQNAINATPNGGTLWIPRGKYLASGLVVNKTISIRGDNGMLTFNNPASTQIDTTAGTTIISPSASQAVLTMNRPGSNIRDIAIMSKRNVTPTTSYGVYWNNAGYMQMENMTIAGFNTNTYFNNGNFAKFSHIVFENPLSANLLIESPSNPDIGDNTIYDCKFSGFNTTSKDIIFHSSGGLNITNSKFVIRGGGVKGAVIDISMQGSTADINFIGNSVEGFNGTFFKVRRNGYQLNNVQISNNQVTPTGAISGSLIDIVGAGQTQITNNILTGSPSVGGTFIIALDSVSNPMVRNNIIPYGFRLSLAHATGIIDTASYNNNIALKNANNAFIGTNSFVQPLTVQSGTATGGLMGGADAAANTITNNTRKIFRISAPSYNSSGGVRTSMINQDNNGTDNVTEVGYTNSGANYGSTVVRIGAVSTTTTTGGNSILEIKSTGVNLISGNLTLTPLTASAMLKLDGSKNVAAAVPGTDYLTASTLPEKFLRLTGSGTGAATTISFPHGQTGVTASSIAVVTPINAASSGISYVTCDATNINVTWATAPVSGTNNVSLNVFLKP